MTHAAPVSPIRVLALVLAVVFAVEFIIMLLLASIPEAQRNNVAISFFDSAALVAALYPALWLLIVRPLQALVAERGALLNRTLTIQEEERAQLARDLHDELGQAQTAVLLGLRSVLNSRNLEEAHAAARDVHQLASAAIDSTRRIARGLAPGVLRDFGLGQAVERVCEELASTSGMEIVRDIAIGASRFNPTIEIAAYRVVQEALTNAVKHSGAARIGVAISLADGRLVLTVADTGRGLGSSREEQAASGHGLGLAGMRERVILLGGDFQITSVPAKGTTLHATIPVRPIQP